MFFKSLEPEKLSESAVIPHGYVRLYFEGCPINNILGLAFRVPDKDFIKSLGKFCGLFEALIKKHDINLANKTIALYKDYLEILTRASVKYTGQVIKACGTKDIEIDNENSCRVIWQIEILPEVSSLNQNGVLAEYVTSKILNIPVDGISKKSLMKFVKVYKEVSTNIDDYTSFIGIKSIEGENDNVGNRLINVVNLALQEMISECHNVYIRS